MRNFLTIAVIALAALSSWLFLELRSTSSSFNSHAVTAVEGDLVTATAIESLLYDGDIDGALVKLEKWRLGSTYTLSETRDAISQPSWRWGDQSQLVERAALRLSEQAAYVRLHPDRQRNATQQVTEILVEF
jgi:hypothetical protein